MKLFVVAIFVCCIAAALASPADDPAWKTFKSSHRKNFKNQDEELKRLNTFKKNVDRIHSHNELFKKGKVTFEVEANRFADLPHSEFLNRMTGYSASLNPNTAKVLNETRKLRGPLPASVDWRTSGALRPIRNQLTCGSCWTFASAAAIEAHHQIKTGRSVDLSEQNILDCASPYAGCQGGHMSIAFDYVKRNGGINQLSAYQYENKQGPCRYRPEYKGSSIASHVKLPANSEAELKNALASKGPVVVAMDASPRALQYYKSGVFYDPACSSTQLNHAVLAIGYGTEGGQDYWLIRNSWGGQWGEQGYVKIARNRGNHCGVATDAYYPVL